MIAAIIGSSTIRIKDNFALIENAKTAETTRRAGPLTSILSPIISVFWSIVTSFVILVVRDEVENVSMFLNENELIFSYIDFLSR